MSISRNGTGSHALPAVVRPAPGPGAYAYTPRVPLVQRSSDLERPNPSGASTSREVGSSSTSNTSTGLSIDPHGGASTGRNTTSAAVARRSASHSSNRSKGGSGMTTPRRLERLPTVNGTSPRGEHHLLDSLKLSLSIATRHKMEGKKLTVEEQDMASRLIELLSPEPTTTLKPRSALPSPAPQQPLLPLHATATGGSLNDSSRSTDKADDLKPLALVAPIPPFPPPRHNSVTSIATLSGVNSQSESNTLALVTSPLENIAKSSSSIQDNNFTNSTSDNSNTNSRRVSTLSTTSTAKPSVGKTYFGALKNHVRSDLKYAKSKAEMTGLIDFTLQCTTVKTTEDLCVVTCAALEAFDDRIRATFFLQDQVDLETMVDPVGGEVSHLTIRELEEVEASMGALGRQESTTHAGFRTSKTGEKVKCAYLPLEVEGETSLFGMCMLRPKLKDGSEGSATLDDLEGSFKVLDTKTEDQLRQLSTIISIACLSFRNLRLYEGMMWQAERAEAMLMMANQLSRDNLNEDVLMTSIITKVRELTESDRCAVFLVRGQNLQAYFEDGTSVKMPLTQGIAGHVAVTGEVLNIPDVYEDPRFNKAVDKVTGYRTKTMLCLPVRYEGTIVAVAQLVNKLPIDHVSRRKSVASAATPLAAATATFDGASSVDNKVGGEEEEVANLNSHAGSSSTRRSRSSSCHNNNGSTNDHQANISRHELDSAKKVVERQFTQRDQESFLTFSTMIGVCLRNCRVNADLVLEQRKSELLLDCAKNLGQTDIRNEDSVVDTVLHGAKDLLNADRVSLFLIDREHDQMYSKIADATGGREIRFPLGTGIAGTVARTMKGENIEDAYNDPRFNREFDKQLGYRTQSILCQPIIRQGEVLAVAQLVNKHTPISVGMKKERGSGLVGKDLGIESFTAQDELVFQNFADFAGISLYNARLLQFAVKAGEEAVQLSRLSASGLGGPPRRTGSMVLRQVNATTLIRVKGLSERVLSKGGVDVLASARKRSFNLFSFRDQYAGDEECTAHDAASLLVTELIWGTGLPQANGCEKDILLYYVLACKAKYRSVPYHNFFHVVDCVQTLITFLYEGKVIEMVTELEAFTILITALAHDLDHMGVNNSFHMKTDSPLGMLSSASGNKSVLEVHHCNVAIEILDDPLANVFSGLPSSSSGSSTAEGGCGEGGASSAVPAGGGRSAAFKLLIDGILATDMARHLELMTRFNEMSEEGFDRSRPEHRALVLQVLLKATDISNVTKPFEVSRLWAICVTEEFYKQGDKEKESGVVDVLPLFDRSKASELATGQIGFINFVAKKFFLCICSLLTGIQWTADQVALNVEEWQRILEERKATEGAAAAAAAAAALTE